MTLPLKIYRNGKYIASCKHCDDAAALCCVANRTQVYYLRKHKSNLIFTSGEEPGDLATQTMSKRIKRIDKGHPRNETYGVYNERYVIWAKLHGNTPEQQLQADKEQFPGGSMFGFQNWIRKHCLIFAKQINEPAEVAVIANQEKFTEYLEGVTE